MSDIVPPIFEAPCHEMLDVDSPALLCMLQTYNAVFYYLLWGIFITCSKPFSLFSYHVSFSPSFPICEGKLFLEIGTREEIVYFCSASMLQLTSWKLSEKHSKQLSSIENRQGHSIANKQHNLLNHDHNA